MSIWNLKSVIYVKGTQFVHKLDDYDQMQIDKYSSVSRGLT